MSSRTNATTVLIVDDEKDVADVYRLQLQKTYDVKTAYGGEEALETIDETVNVVLLDRRMPDLTGDDVFQEIRKRGFDCRVVMISAVNRDAEADVPGDDYYMKPLGQESLHEAVGSQLATSSRSHKPE